MSVVAAYDVATPADVGTCHCQLGFKYTKFVTMTSPSSAKTLRRNLFVVVVRGSSPNVGILRFWVAWVRVPGQSSSLPMTLQPNTTIADVREFIEIYGNFKMKFHETFT